MDNNIEPEDTGEYILGVSLLYEEKHIRLVASLPRPNRHHHLFKLITGGVILSSECQNLTVQGFYTNKRDFITREEALLVAKAANQLIQKTHPITELFSEDLWSNTIMFDRSGNEV